MKLLIFILLFAIGTTPLLADIPIIDNEVVGLLGDSELHDGDSTAPQTGCKAPDYFISTFYLMFPEKTNIMCFNWGRSGGTTADAANHQATVGLVTHEFNAHNGMSVGDYTNIELEQAGSAGNQLSNQMLLSLSNNYQFPAIMTNGTANVNESGWSTTNKVAMFSVGNSDWSGSAADGTDGARNNAAVNAGAMFGAGSADCYNINNLTWSNINQTDPAALYVVSGPKALHYFTPGSLSWCSAWWKSFFAGYSNIANITVDGGLLTVVATNNAVVKSIVQNGNTYQLVVRWLRQPPAWDVAGTVDYFGNVITNDATQAYTEINTNDANFWQQTIAVTNLPSGNYTLSVSNVVLASGVPSATLAKGINIAYITKGFWWQQRAQVLSQIRLAEGADPVTLVLENGGGSKHWVGLGSLLAAEWPTVHGDALLTNVVPAAGYSANDLIWGFQTNSTGSFAAIRKDARPADVTLTITQTGNNYVPAPFR